MEQEFRTEYRIVRLTGIFNTVVPQKSYSKWKSRMKLYENGKIRVAEIYGFEQAKEHLDELLEAQRLSLDAKQRSYQIQLINTIITTITTIEQQPKIPNVKLSKEMKFSEVEMTTRLRNTLRSLNPEIGFNYKEGTLGSELPKIKTKTLKVIRNFGRRTQQELMEIYDAARLKRPQ